MTKQELKAEAKRKRRIVQARVDATRTTSHVLHLILSLITCGFWVIVWVLCGLSNAAVRNNAISVLAAEDVSLTD